jgi:hypothetical protein
MPLGQLLSIGDGFSEVTRCERGFDCGESSGRSVLKLLDFLLQVRYALRKGRIFPDHGIEPRLRRTTGS